MVSIPRIYFDFVLMTLFDNDNNANSGHYI